MAAPATIAGDISSVRPVGLPCRPLKFRFDEDALTCRPCSLSGFMPRHIEHPAPRHSNPAATNTSCNPSASAARRTACDPGTTRPVTPARNALAAHDARRFAQVREARIGAGPDERDVDRRALNPGARLEPHELERLRHAGALLLGHVARPGDASPTRTRTVPG